MKQRKATKTPKRLQAKAASADQALETTTQEGADEELVSNAVSSHEKWQQAQEYVAEVDLGRVGDRLPNLTMLVVLGLLLQIDRKTIGPNFQLSLQWVDSDKARIFRQAYERLIILVFALFHALGRLQTKEPINKKQLRRDLARAEELRAQGFRWLDILVTLGHVSADEAQRIKDGRGHLDLASDLTQLALLLRSVWEVLEPMQKFEKDEAMRLTEALLDEMDRHGATLFQVLNGLYQSDDKEIDWRAQVIILWHLLERSYHLVRSLLIFVMEVTDRSAETAELPTLYAMHNQLTRRHRSGRKGSSAASDDKEAPEPVDLEEIVPEAGGDVGDQPR